MREGEEPYRYVLLQWLDADERLYMYDMSGYSYALIKYQHDDPDGEPVLSRLFYALNTVISN